MTSGARHASQFPGFDGLRLVCATAVIFSHSFQIAEGDFNREPLRALLGDWIFGDFAVFAFFIISGFLLARSLARNPNAVQFSINRALRILPGFVFCALVTGFVIGPLVTATTLRSYFSQSATYDYVTSTISCLCVSWEIPFTFEGQRLLRRTINASLWSLPYEALCYVFLLWLWMLLRVPTLVVAAMAVAGLLAVFYGFFSKVLFSGIAHMLPYFAAGVVMHAIQERFGTRNWLAWIALAALCASPFYMRENYAFTIFGAYLIVHAAQRDNIGSAFARKCGDLSYGLYLFGWPVTATIKHFAGTENGWLLGAYSIPLTGLVAAVSWWSVERPFLLLKGMLRRAAFAHEASH